MYISVLAHSNPMICLEEVVDNLYSFELGTIEKGLEQRLVRYRPILYVHVYIFSSRLEAVYVWGRHGLGLSNA